MCVVVGAECCVWAGVMAVVYAAACGRYHGRVLLLRSVVRGWLRQHSIIFLLLGRLCQCEASMSKHVLQAAACRLHE